MRRHASVLGALVALLGLLLALAGCGSEEESAKPEPEPQVGADDAFFGIAPQETPNEADLARMSAGGVRSYHVLLSWPGVETARGVYDWAGYDDLLTELAQNGIEPVPFVFGTPSFYAEERTVAPTSGKALDAWSAFLRAAAERYGPDGAFWQDFEASNPGVGPQPLIIWEIWNEPNSSLFWKPRPDPADYADLLTRSAEELRSVDPEAEIMIGGMFATPVSDNAIVSFDYLEQLFAEDGVADAVDVVGVHPYSPRVGGRLGVIDQVERTRKTIDAAGSDADIWATELGWGSDPEVPNQLAKTPDQQASLLEESLGTLYDDRESLGLRGVLWFSWHDANTNPECGWCAASGLVDADRDSKPAWIAYTKLAGGEP